jgi:tetratricopeptide (TPR) repeat protein
LSTNEAENEKDPRPEGPLAPASDPESPEPEGTETTAGAEGEGSSASDEPIEESDAVADESAEVPAGAEVSAKPAEPGKSTSTAAMTPGQRLAAARAAKSAKKTAQRGREADEREKRAIDTAEVVREKAASYLGTNRRIVWGAIATLAIAAGVLVGVRNWQASEEQAAGALLEEASRIQLATIRTEDERAATEGDDEPTYTSKEARAEAALEKYRAVTSGYPGTDAAAWAHVGEGRALLDRNEPAEARAAYQKAIDAAEGDPAVTRQALEGIGFSFEAEENWDEALSTYEELGALANGLFESWGDYHAARMLLRKGDEDQAKQRLQTVLERLRTEDAPAAPYLRRQVESRLALLDPSLGTQSGGAQDQLSPEQLQELIRQAQARQGQSGETP